VEDTQGYIRYDKKQIDSYAIKIPYIRRVTKQVERKI